jgi:hypothetical protein
LDFFSLKGARVQGHRVDVSWQREAGLVVQVDGREAARYADRGRIEVPL